MKGWVLFAKQVSVVPGAWLNFCWPSAVWVNNSVCGHMTHPVRTHRMSLQLGTIMKVAVNVMYQLVFELLPFFSVCNVLFKEVALLV